MEYAERSRASNTIVSKLPYLISDFIKIVTFGLTSFVLIIPSPFFFLGAFIAYELNVIFHYRYLKHYLNVGGNNAYHFQLCKMRNISLFEFIAAIALVAALMIPGIPLLLPIGFFNLITLFATFKRMQILNPYDPYFWFSVGNSFLLLSSIFVLASEFLTLFATSGVSLISFVMCISLGVVLSLALNLITCCYNSTTDISFVNSIDDDDFEASFPNSDQSNSCCSGFSPCCNKEASEEQAMETTTERETQRSSWCPTFLSNVRRATESELVPTSESAVDDGDNDAIDHAERLTIASV